MKRGIIILLIITMLFTYVAASNSQESIVVCATTEQYRVEDLQEQLNEKFPQYNVIVMYMSTGKAAAKVYAEGSGTEVDILLAMESGYLSKLKEHLADISGRSTIPYLDGFKPEDNHNLWVTWERFGGAIIVNTEVLEKYGLEKPTGYEDLLKPEYKDLIAMPDPKSSGTGFFFFQNWVNIWGEEATLKFVDKLHGNVKQFTESGSGPIKLLKQGEIAIGLGMTYQAITEANDGQPFEVIFPESGSPYSLTGATIIKGHQDKKGVSEIYDYIIHEFMIYDKENYSPEPVYEGQINMVPNYPEEIPLADMTGIQDDKEKERLLAIWKY